MRKMNLKRKWLLAIVPAVMLTAVGFVARPAGDDYFEISKNLDIFGKMYREVHTNYVDDIEPTDFMRTGMEAMLKSLDPYTNYISAAEIEDYRFMSTGQYGGIGAMVGRHDNKVIITEPYEDSPAAKAGLRAGDVIIQIDNEKINADNSKNIDVRDLLRGQPKSKLKNHRRARGPRESADGRCRARRHQNPQRAVLGHDRQRNWLHQPHGLHGRRRQGSQKRP